MQSPSRESTALELPGREAASARRCPLKPVLYFRVLSNWFTLTLLCLLLKRKEEKVTQAEPRHLQILPARHGLPDIFHWARLGFFAAPEEGENQVGLGGVGKKDERKKSELGLSD